MEGAQPLAVALPSGTASGPRLWKLVTSTRSVWNSNVVCWLLSDPGPIPDIDYVERFGRDVDGEELLRGVERGDGHAGAVERDAVTETHVVEIAVGHRNAEPLAVG